MDEHLQQETLSLVQAWSQHAMSDLRDYLVADVEDPRLNVQSILSRHMLIRALAGDRFETLCDHELRFACVLNWLLARIKAGADSDWLDAQLAELLMEADPVTRTDAAEMDDPDEQPPVPPALLRDTAAMLPSQATDPDQAVPDYLVDALTIGEAELIEPTVPERVLSIFEQIWAERLASLRVADPPRVLEPACGSANDYRFLHTFGLAPQLAYHGFDLCRANINNAKAMFPEAAACFTVDNVFAIRAEDNAYDYVFTHDLLEHLSPEGIEAAIGELSRVTRKALMVHFFNLDDRPEHDIQPIEHYYWNLLSLPRVRERFEARGGRVEATHIPTMLSERFRFEESHNREAWTLTVHFD